VLTQIVIRPLHIYNQTIHNDNGANMGKKLVCLVMAAAVALGLFPGAALASDDGGMLKIGDQGEYVRALQDRLGELGYFSGAATGYFGVITQQAVIGYQQDHHLTVDGKAGPDTLSALMGTRVPETKARPWPRCSGGWPIWNTTITTASPAITARSPARR
jgi:hypothetical protein